MNCLLSTVYGLLFNQSGQMFNATVVAQPPGFSPGVFDVNKVGDAGVVRPHLAAPEGADVENMVVGQLNDAAMTDGDDGFVSVALDHFFQEHAHAGAKMHEGFPVFIMRGDGGKRPF